MCYYLFIIGFYCYIFNRGVNVNALTHVIHLKFVMQMKSHYKVWPQRLAVMAARKVICRVWWGYSASVVRVAAQQAGYLENTEL